MVGVHGAVFLSALFASAIEVIEMVAIVVAVGVSRSWRASLLGAGAGLVMLIAVIAALGPALQDVPLQPLRLVVGTLLLVFGLGWLRKGILRVARDGWMAGGVGYEEFDEGPVPSGGHLDWTAFVLSFKGVSLEGLEVAVLVVAFGAASRDFASAALGAAVAVVGISVLGGLTYRFVARIPRRTMQFFVGAMLTTFGTFWSVEGTGVPWPGGDWALVWLAGFYLVASLGTFALIRRRRSQGSAMVGPEAGCVAFEEPA